MRFLVQLPDLDSFLYESHRGSDLAQVLEKFQKLQASGQLVEGGLLADERGGFLVMEGETQGQIESLLAGLFDLERLEMEIHPILSFAHLDLLFREMKKEGLGPEKGKRPMAPAVRV